MALSLQPEKPNLTGNTGYQKEPAGYRAGGADCQPSESSRLTGRERTRRAATCAEAEDNYRLQTNDLIQQRRAADAAEATAVFTYQQTRIAAWGVALGIITMGAAIAAAFYARGAAVGTQEANSIAGKAAARAQRDSEDARIALIRSERAIIKVNSGAVEAPPLATTDAVMIALRIINQGKTNATDFEIYWSISDEPVFAMKGNRYKLHSNDICIPGADHSLPPFKVKVRKKYPIYVMGHVDYATSYGAAFRTYYCLEIDGLPARNQFGGIDNGHAFSHPCQGLPRDT